jgi:hypothetical protein
MVQLRRDPADRFEVGQQVRWTSGPKLRQKVHQGEVVVVVEPDRLPIRVLPEGFDLAGYSMLSKDNILYS